MNSTALLLTPILLAIIIVPVVLIISKINKIKKSKDTERYNFHLGEMTMHDIPKNDYIKGQKINKKYYSKYNKKDKWETNKKQSMH